MLIAPEFAGGGKRGLFVLLVAHDHNADRVKKLILSPVAHLCSITSCPNDMLQSEDILAGGGEITINGAPVTGLTGLAKAKEKNSCYVLQGEDGSHYFEPDANGRFVIAARSKTKDMAMYFSSFIIW